MIPLTLELDYPSRMTATVDAQSCWPYREDDRTVIDLGNTALRIKGSIEDAERLFTLARMPAIAEILRDRHLAARVLLASLTDDTSTYDTLYEDWRELKRRYHEVITLGQNEAVHGKRILAATGQRLQAEVEAAIKATISPTKLQRQIAAMEHLHNYLVQQGGQPVGGLGVMSGLMAECEKVGMHVRISDCTARNAGQVGDHYTSSLIGARVAHLQDAVAAELTPTTDPTPGLSRI